MKRALISVYDKTGIVEFTKKLVFLGWEIISTGGTSKLLKAEGIDVIDVSEITDFPECFDGRVKSLHPKIHGGLLALKDNDDHISTMRELGINSIDMVVNNLYPFKETILNKNATHEEIIENIDIGGPSMLRAAAKNYKFVTVIVDHKDYEDILEEIKTKTDTSEQTRLYLATKAFGHTSHYDTLISNYFNEIANIDFLDTISFTYEKKQDLRYGENPQQKGAYYIEIKDIGGTLSVAEQLHGKELSYNNISDSNGAIEILKEFDEPTVVAVKHGNPCGIGSDNDLKSAFIKAYECDKVSIFGGIVAVNRKLDEETAKLINDIFIEIIIAPSYSKEALDMLKSKKNLRILELPNINETEYKSYAMTKTLGGMLIQDRNTMIFNDEDIEIVTDRKPSQEEMRDLHFAWKAVKGVKSNAIVIAKNRATIGVGPGQVSRIWALENAIRQGGESVRGSVMASDAFFPFSDCIEEAHKAGITAVIQPGGSKNDEDSIELANKYGISMVFTGIRHFKH